MENEIKPITQVGGVIKTLVKSAASQGERVGRIEGISPVYITPEHLMQDVVTIGGKVVKQAAEEVSDFQAPPHIVDIRV